MNDVREALLATLRDLRASTGTPAEIAKAKAVAHAASLASQRYYRQLNEYWSRVYWLRETTRLYWEIPK